MSLLEKINKENDIKDLKKGELPVLASEIREFLIDKVSANGGHLASNLGAVELTMALHLCMNFPEDKLIFDVGHQAYTHKILTGRAGEFDSLRTMDGLSGFPKRTESDCDAFNTGHSSTSISAAMGYAMARDLKGGKERVAAVIGDGSLTGGMAYEAINSLAQQKTGCVIILNDNEMSIDRNVGGLSKYLTEIRVGEAYNGFKTGIEKSLISSKPGLKIAKTLKRSKDSIKQLLVPGMFFEEIGITYVGPIDGHNIKTMVSTFEKAFRLNKPIIVHVKTKKGCGYRFAEKHPDYFHGISPFDKNTGRLLDKKTGSSYTDVFAKTMLKIGEKYPNTVAITAAMAQGTGLQKFAYAYPDRFFDVGIAEQHAVTFAAGMAAANITPIVAIYSSFLQRAYDQILHDVCLQKLHVVFAIDRTGLVGQDGETHQGIYDVAYLTHLPNMVVMAPKNRYEFEKMMDFAVNYDGPIAVKYPRGLAYTGLKEFDSSIELNKSERIYDGSEVAIIACGTMMEEAVKVVALLQEQGISPMLINARFLSSVDEDIMNQIMDKCDIIVTMEEQIKVSGYGEHVDEYLMHSNNVKAKNMKHITVAIEDGVVKQGSIGELRNRLGIDAEHVAKRILAAWEE